MRLIPFVLTLYTIIFIAPINSWAASIWCNPANSGAENGTTKATGYKTLLGAIAVMTSGDEIIIANGDYSTGYTGMKLDSDYQMPPSGSSYSAMSTIRAETDWGVRLPNLGDGGAGRSYLLIQGIVFYGDNHNIASYWTHSKFIRCGFYVGKLTENESNFSLSYGSYNLIEECIAWGGGRYKFLDYHGNYNIYRRCVARHDWYVSDPPLWNGQESNFRGYGSTNSAWQNCISIDSDREQYQTTSTKEDGDFWIGDQSGSGGNIIDGCIVVKGMYQSFYLGGTQSADTKVVIKDSIAIGPSLSGSDWLTGAFTIGNVIATVSNVASYNFNTGYQHFLRNNKSGGSIDITNSWAMNVGVLYGNGISSDYMYYYNAGAGSYGSHSVNANPMTNGILYPVRVESGSAMETAGSGGGRVGPTILYKLGTQGTSMDQAGWDTVTSDKLWPFPNEDTIKTLMSTTVDGVSGIYGFTSGTSMDGSPQTLTKYIWEQFGNQIPGDIYGAIPTSSARPWGISGRSIAPSGRPIAQ